MNNINDERHLNAIAKATEGDEEEFCPYTGLQMARGEHLTSHKPIGQSSIMEDMLNIKKLSEDILNAK